MMPPEGWVPVDHAPDDWTLTDQRIAQVLADVRDVEIPRCAYCPDKTSSVRFSLHVIAEKALTDLQRLRAMERRMEELAEELEGMDIKRTGVAYVATEIRSRMKGTKSS